MNRAERRRQRRLAAKTARKPRHSSAPGRAPAQPNSDAANALALAIRAHAAGRATEAERICRRVLRAEPDCPEALHLLGLIASQTGRNDEAVPLIERALAVKPDYIEAHNNLGIALKKLGRLNEAVDNFRKALALKPDAAEAHYNLLFALYYAPGTAPEELLAAHRAWNDHHAAPVRATAGAATDPDRRPLTVGLMGAGAIMRRHPALWLTLPALETLDPGVVRIAAYVDGTVNEDDFTARLKRICFSWRSIAGLDAARAAGRIRADGVDILISLSGHTESPLLVCAHRAAPVQAIWGGHWGTTGLDDMDWLVADDVIVPAGEERWYSERVYRMPDGYAVYQPPDNAPPVNTLPARTAGHVTFGSFNRPAKVNEETVALWARVLKAVPGSRLFLKGDSFAEDERVRLTRDLFSGHGVAPERLLFEGRSPHDELLACYNRVDIALDTWPYSGGLTTCEALWMGVPVLTLPGRSFAGRTSASHLANIGLDGWIADTADAFAERAAWWAEHPNELAALRTDLRRRVGASPLCDGPRFARHLEQALQAMWRAPAGRRPARSSSCSV